MKNTGPPEQKDTGTNIPHMERPPAIKEFQKAVLGYYRDHGRDLAWRETTDPYHILVSEIMLQQTQVERVSVKFPAFIGRFPDFGSLAEAPLPDVLLAWQGMGYNRRALSLQKCARRVVEEHDGTLPQDPEVLATFPGIGRATAASICAFAFNMPVVFIETNIRRVFIHYFFGNAKTVDDTEILPWVKKTLYEKDPRTWYNALMDLGTDLKMSVGNPNRRSRHYTKQAAFEGSDRKIRGSILRILLAGERLTQKAIIQKTG
jgi:A/G-specific adenine glycosylase